MSVVVEECYLHCAKALIRSAFWSTQPITIEAEYEYEYEAKAKVVTLLAGCHFMALATVDAEGRTDVSPKGDPAGKLLQWRDGAARYSDRPGNRRVDSFRNILMQPHVAALAMVPGDEQ